MLMQYEREGLMVDLLSLEQRWIQPPAPLSTPTGFKSAGRRLVRLGVVSLLVAMTASADGGGGSSSLHSLDRDSDTPSTTVGVYTDSSGPVAKSSILKGQLDLDSMDNLDALSTGRENGVAAILGTRYGMSSESIRYQFSVDRDAVDGFEGGVTDSLGTPLTIYENFNAEFLNNDQAADILDNVGLGTDRFNFLQVDEEKLELKGNLGGAISEDDIDGFTSTGALGGEPDSDGDGVLDRAVYFSVDAQSSTLLPSVIYVKPPGLPRQVYATWQELDIQIDDDIDALSIWDANENFEFDAGDAVVFSLRRNSPSLPMDVGVLSGPDAVTEGGIFLALPSQGVVEALPAGFFALEDTDELDAVHVLDPRQMQVPCDGLGLISQPIQAHEALVATPSFLEFNLDGSTPDIQHSMVVLNSVERQSALDVVTSFNVIALVDNPGVVQIADSFSLWCGPAGECSSCGGGMGGGSPCNSSADGFSAWNLPTPANDALGGPYLMGSNQCLGSISLRAVAPGTATVRIRGTAANGSAGLELIETVIYVRVVAAPGSVFGACSSGVVTAPCGNYSDDYTGCLNSTGLGGGLQASGTASLAADDLEFESSQLPVGQPVLLFVGINQLNGGLGVPFGNGLRCAGGQVRRLGVRFTDGAGRAAWGPSMGADGWNPAPTVGETRAFQAWYRDPVDSACGSTFNLTNGYAVTFQP